MAEKSRFFLPISNRISPETGWVRNMNPYFDKD